LVFETWSSQGFWVIACCDLDLLTQKSNQHIYESKYICNQNWVKFPSLVCEIRCSQGYQVIALCDIALCDLRPFDLISMSQAEVHTVPNFGKISFNIYKDIVFVLL